MEEIELVVKIPEKLYKHIMSMQFYIPGSRNGKSVLEGILKAIRTGTPLPKGHGRLGDLDELTQRITNYIEHNEHMMDELTLLQEKFILEGIKDTHTIIEADREV